MKYFIPLFVVLSIIASVMVLAQDTEFHPCIYKAGGKSYDLTSFDSVVLNGDIESPTHHYYASLCGNLHDPCGHLNSALCKKPASGLFGVSLASNSLDKLPEPKVTATTKDSFTLTYSNSDPICDDENDTASVYTVDIHLHCSSEEDQALDFVFKQKSLCHGEFDLKHPDFCGTSAGGDGLSGGAIFLIVLFSVLAGYFIIGFLVCKFVFKKPGFVQSVPQYAFWCALPGLFIAGIKCFAGKLCGKKQGGSVSSDEYESYGSV